MTGNLRKKMFGVEIDALRLDEAVDQLAQWVAEPFSRCRYVVTPNVDHIVMLQHDRAFKRTYGEAELVLADGWPVVWAAKLVGQSLPGLVPGSDLTPALMAAWKGPEPMRVFLLGAMPGVAEVAAKNIESRWEHVRVSDVYSPPLGFEYDEVESSRIVDRVNAAAPDVLVVGVGALKQELWVYRHRHLLQAKTALCVGATIDFLAGEKKRAPKWIRRLGLEWLHRVSSEPKRLAKRYLRDATEFPRIVLAELHQNLFRRRARA